MTPDNATRVGLAETETLVAAALRAAGLGPEHCGPVAAQFTAAERDGIGSHGLARIPALCALVRSGKINGTAMPTMSRPRPGLVRVDVGDNFPHLGIAQGSEMLFQAARENGLAMMTVAHGYHCGVLGYHTERMAAAGFVVLGLTHAPAAIAPWGGRRPVVGTNPISCAVPRDGAPPFVIDQSSSVVAKNEVVDYDLRGAPIPAHWAFDADGKPTTSAAAALEGGTMAPAGGYKGFGLGLIVEVFSALLSGSNTGIAAPALGDMKTPPAGIGQCFIAVDAAAAPATFAPGLTAILAAIADQDGTRIPGDRRLAHRAAAQLDGLLVPLALRALAAT